MLRRGVALILAGRASVPLAAGVGGVNGNGLSAGSLATDGVVSGRRLYRRIWSLMTLVLIDYLL